MVSYNYSMSLATLLILEGLSLGFNWKAGCYVLHLEDRSIRPYMRKVGPNVGMPIMLR